VARDRELAMDAYAFAIEVLRADDCRRLRAYVPDPNVRFTSWLVVVTRRLVLDFVRQRYGRSRSTNRDYQEQHLARRRLEDLLTDEIDPDALPSSGGSDADAELRRRELTRALAGALDRLSATDRLLVALRFEDDRPVREIAQTLGLPSVFHVYRRLTAVLSILRDVLHRRGVDEPQP
jgi:RNA polymerase sigma factor (sigma-70 family)